MLMEDMYVLFLSDYNKLGKQFVINQIHKIMFKLTSSALRLSQFSQRQLTLTLLSSFAFPKHEVLTMPALSPTMKEGKILKWYKKAGDQVQPGDVICEVETDKATMGFEVQEKGFLAKTLDSSDTISLGTPLAIVTKKASDIGEFATYKFGASPTTSEPVASQPTPTPTPAPSTPQPPVQTGKVYPSHSMLKMPAVSPTMTEGKILKWKIQPGDSFVVGDALFSIETDKAVVDYEATEKGVLAKVMAKENETLPIGQSVAVVVKSKDAVSQFSDFVEGQAVAAPTSAPAASSPATNAQTHTQTHTHSSGDRVIASPLAKTVANERGIDLSQVKGSGPNGRVIKQDVDSFVPTKPVVEAKKEEVVVETKKETKPQKPKGFAVPENPFEDITLSSMRKTIANRLTESKQTIPHYYITSSIEMGATNALRNELNKREKENGVKISINDIIIKAMALALRDYPNVNVQWQGNAVRKFKYADVSVAVAIDGGLVTPIVFRADTLGLLDIARRTKDIAKRARDGKLDPMEFIGGTSTVSNLGMFGINTVSSIINPPQATILGVGKAEKKIVFQEGETPYRVAEVMDIIASVDHRAVDGALAAQWLNRIKLYLEHPTNMLL